MPHNNYRTIKRGLLVLLFMITVTACGTDQKATAQNVSPQPLSLKEYFTKMQQLANTNTNSTPTFPQGKTAREVLLIRKASYEQDAKIARTVIAPKQLKQAHSDYIKALDEQASIYGKIIDRTPLAAPSADSLRYIYETAEYSYAFFDENGALCAIHKTGVQLGYSLSLERACDDIQTAGPGRSVGTTDQPVNVVTIVHKPIPPTPTGIPRPNVFFEVTSITARAFQPITITLDNRNPLPFLFNISVYRGQAKILRPEDELGVTIAGGPKVTVVSVTLAPGIYTFADNVHPTITRGTLTVV